MMNIFFKEFHEDNMIKIVIAGMEELKNQQRKNCWNILTVLFILLLSALLMN